MGGHDQHGVSKGSDARSSDSNPRTCPGSCNDAASTDYQPCDERYSSCNDDDDDASAVAEVVEAAVKQKGDASDAASPVLNILASTCSKPP